MSQQTIYNRKKNISKKIINCYLKKKHGKHCSSLGELRRRSSEMRMVDDVEGLK